MRHYDEYFWYAPQRRHWCYTIRRNGQTIAQAIRCVALTTEAKARLHAAQAINAANDREMVPLARLDDTMTQTQTFTIEQVYNLITSEGFRDWCDEVIDNYHLEIDEKRRQLAAMLDDANRAD